MKYIVLIGCLAYIGFVGYIIAWKIDVLSARIRDSRRKHKKNLM